MPAPDDPLLLWCSSHDTLASEEIPLFVEAGFRVVPLLTNFWTERFDPGLDSTICSAWRESVGLPADVVRGLQALTICQANGGKPFAPADLALLAKHVDAVYVTVHPHVAVRLASEFPRTVIFRAFGHGGLNTYSRICEHNRVSLDEAGRRPNLVWCPILSTLQEPEDDRLCRNPQHLRAFVTPGRLGADRWSPQASEAYVVETIPRIEAQDFYRQIYARYVSDHGRLPLKILGGNSPGGGPLADPRIVGRLDTPDYFAAVARARISIYHGMSRHHVHYHPIEFMALGVPVLFHQASAFAAEARGLGMGEATLVAAGMYADAEAANRVAEAALADAAVAATIAEKQRFLLERIFSRPAALEQAIWLRTLVVQRRQRAAAEGAASRKPSRHGLVRAGRAPPEGFVMTSREVETGAFVGCRVCGGRLKPKWTLAVLGRHEAEYFECAACGCLQIPNPWWLDEAYRDEDKPKAFNPDGGRFCRNYSAYVRLRALEHAGLFAGPLRVLDYGGGSGLLAAMLVLAGRKCRQFDPYCPIPLFAPDLAYTSSAEIPRGGFNAVVALEVFEHLCDPLDVARALAGYLAPGGTLVLSTGIYEPGVHTADWPYLSRPAGQHVTFYTRRALRVLADACGLRTVCLFPADEGFLILLTSVERRRAARCLWWARWALARRRLLAFWTDRAWDMRHHIASARRGRTVFVD